jgi:aminoglycoside phosphotransferase (APT) family kinase protein
VETAQVIAGYWEKVGVKAKLQILVWAEYNKRAGTSQFKDAFYYAFGLFKVAVIVQQIFARYHRGATRDQRFATMDRLVGVLARHAARVAERGTL